MELSQGAAGKVKGERENEYMNHRHQAANRRRRIVKTMKTGMLNFLSVKEMKRVTNMTMKATALALALLGTMTLAFAEQAAAQKSKPAAGLQNPFQVQAENWRGKPHYEVLIMNRNAKGPGGAGNYYNSLGLSFDVSDKEMDARFWALDPEKLKQQYGGDGVRFNGPRRFLVNRFSAQAFDGGKKFMMGPIPMYVYGTFVVPDFDAFIAGKQAPYQETVSKRSTTWYFNAGEEVYELVSPEGAVFTMFSASLRVDPNNTVDKLPTLGKRLSLPKGWKFRVRTLEKELVLVATYDSDPPNTIVLDQFENNYQRNP